MTTVAVAGATWPIYIPGLYSQADTKLFITNPTIAAGDFQRSINGGAWTNMDNLPVVTPALSTQVYILLSVAETTAAAAGGQINVRWVDALGGQWCSGSMLIFVHAAEVDAAVHLDPTQGAVEFGQVKILANVAGEGALHTFNANATGHGIEGSGGAAGIYGIGNDYGQLLAGGVDGLRTAGTAGYGIQATGGTLGTEGFADEIWDELIAAHLDAGSTGEALSDILGCTCGGGAIAFTYTVTDSGTGLPIDGVCVWITTDAAGTNVIWIGHTDAFGVARDNAGGLPMLDAGTYRFWRQLAGYVFVNPDVEIVS